MAKHNYIRFDWAIKRLLRNKADYTVLEGFLSVLLKEDITIINIKESETNKAHSDDKYNRVDLLVEDSNKELIIIEMQNNSEPDYLMRMLYGVSKAVTEQLSAGMEYGKIRKVYHVNIVYFRMGDGKDYVYRGTSEFRGIHNRNVLQLTRDQKKFFMKKRVRDVFPEYYILCVHDFNNVAIDSLDQWIYYLKNTEIPENFTARGLKEAREKLKYDRLSEEQKLDYDHHLKQACYEQNSLKAKYTEGRNDGIEEGLAIGKEEGLAIGNKERDRLKAEKEAVQAELKEKNINIVKNSLKAGLSLETISSITGISLEDIEKLLDEF